MFEKCIGTSRYIYNRCIDYVNNKEGPITLISIRQFIMGTDKTLPKDLTWMKDTPYDTRQLMIKSFIGNYRSAKTNFKKGNISHFSLQYKSKRSPKQVFFVDHRAVKSNLRIFPSKCSDKFRLKKSEYKWWKKNIDGQLKKDMIVMKEKPNKYYLLIPVKNNITDTKPKEKMVSLDPGVRTFQTIYSPEGTIGSLGKESWRDLYKLHRRIDLIKSKQNNVLSKTRYRMRQRCMKLRTKVSNIVNDLHWKSASFLVKNFESVLIPKFEVSNMKQKKNRKISKVVVRSMESLCHYKFKQRLLYLGKKYKRNIIEVTEEYTSKTCGQCGYINRNLGARKEFICSHCGLKIDRDHNGSRNILIKYISELLSQLTPGKDASRKK